MKIKLDENIPGAVAGILRSRGHDVDTVLEESLGGRDDPFGTEIGWAGHTGSLHSKKHDTLDSGTKQHNFPAVT